MSKKNKPTPKQTPAAAPVQDAKRDVAPVSATIENNENNGGIFDMLTKGWLPYLIIAVLGIGLYANTFHHQFALDDDIIICKNEYVLSGMAGMKDIMSKDVFDSYYKSLNLSAQLAGGRYRPFSVATYAVEQEFIGTLPDGLKPDSWDINKNGVKDAGEDVNGDGLFTDRDFKVRGTTLRHVNNVLLYVLSVGLIYLFLSSYFFKNNKLLAFLISLVFLAHPIHTEVVANMKSRDEILSLMFMVLTLFFSFRYVELKDKKWIAFAAVSYFIALLSKEYGASLLIIVPLSLYVYHKKLSFSDIALLMVAIVVTFGIYYSIRSSIVLDIAESSVQDSELLNNPYLLATESEASATKLFINLKYFFLLLFPTALSSDYSYNVIPYRDYADIGVIASLILMIGSFAAFAYTAFKRHWLAFPIAFALIHLALVNNMFFNIGATMGERLVYHSSLGTSILLVFGLYYLVVRVMKQPIAVVVAIILPLVAIYSYKTVARNPAWKNDYSLTMTDVKTYPNSILLCGNACNRLIEMSEFPKNKEVEQKFLDSAANYGRHALKLHPGYVTTYMNMGMIKMKKGDVDSAAHFWDNVIRLFPIHPNVPQIRSTLMTGYANRAAVFFQKQQVNEGLAELLKGYKYNPQNPKICFDIGNAYMALRNPAKAREYWSIGLKSSPGDQNLQNAMRSTGGL
jgi:tetratricopeptide (TPR) repeat protein